MSMTSSFHASRSIRSLSNNIEMALTTAALFYAPFRKSTGNFRIMLALIGLACLMRVTAMIFWFTPGLMIFLRAVSWRDRLIWAPLIVSFTIFSGLAVDSYFYGKLTASWWNFYEWNILRGVSRFYGRESVFYHLKVTLPLMLNTKVFYFGIGMWKAAFRSEYLTLTVSMAAYLVLSSMQEHKETRFLAPIYPLIIIFCALGAQQLDLYVSKKQRPIRFISKLLLSAVIISNILIGWFYARVHYKGAYEIMDKLNLSKGDGVYILTPCHVLPFKGYLHRTDIKADFLKCHPGAVDELILKEESEERDHFNRDPIGFVKDEVIGAGYNHLILYESDVEKYRDLFTSKSYEECSRVKSSKIIKRRGDLLIYCKKTT